MQNSIFSVFFHRFRFSADMYPVPDRKCTMREQQRWLYKEIQKGGPWASNKRGALCAQARKYVSLESFLLYP